MRALFLIVLASISGCTTTAVSVETPIVLIGTVTSGKSVAAEAIERLRHQ
jgi:hypothetical protein